MKNHLWLVCLVLMVTGCSVTSNQDTTGDTVVGETIDTSAEAQTRYKQEWLSAVEGKVWAGRPDVWGGGPTKFAGIFLFDTEGNLHNTDDDSFVTGKKYYSLHQVLSFRSGTQAVVKFYKSASPKLASEVYALKISNGSLYRTYNVIDSGARGFATTSTWNGRSYSEENMTIFATNPTSTHSMYQYPTTPLTVPGADS